MTFRPVLRILRQERTNRDHRLRVIRDLAACKVEGVDDHTVSALLTDKQVLPTPSTPPHLELVSADYDQEKRAGVLRDLRRPICRVCMWSPILAAWVVEQLLIGGLLVKHPVSLCQHIASIWADGNHRNRTASVAAKVLPPTRPATISATGLLQRFETDKLT